MGPTGRRQRIDELAAALERDDLDGAHAEVRQLVSVATAVAEQPRPTMDADARDRVRERLLAEIHLDLAEAAPSAPARPAATRSARRAPARSPRVALATGLASAMVAAGGVTVAAQEALPGDALYSVKKATESVRVAVAADAVDASRLELRLARERLDEVSAAAARGTSRSTSMVGALAEMDRRSIDGVQGLLVAAQQRDDEQLLTEAASFTDVQFSELAGAYRDLPAAVRPHAEDSLAILRALRTELLGPALEACAACDDVIPAGSADPEVRPVTSTVPEQAETTAQRQERERSDAEPDPQPAPETEQPRRERNGGEGMRLLDPERERTRSAPRGDGLLPRLPTTLDDVGSGLGRVVDDVVDTTTGLVEDTTSTLEDTTRGVLDGLLREPAGRDADGDDGDDGGGGLRLLD